MKIIGIFYGSSSGNTEGVAKQIQAEFGADNAQVFDVAKATKDDLEKFDNLIFGTSTWGFGELQDDFDGFMKQIEAANLSGKTVALFGCGDQESYSDTFVDGMGLVWQSLQGKGCNIVGQTSTEGYSYSSSQSDVEGKFVGLAIDENNQSDQTADRVKAWVEVLKNAFK
ncbi:flavodoxin [Bacteroidetes oral taxon 274 str. F0058]|jgi:flavodoxin|nr:flavodoxin [Bacteroidetes oral taxon 274 str. F0058]